MSILKAYQFVLKKPLVYLVIYAITIRLLVVIFYNSVTLFPDSQDYINLSEYLSRFNLINYTGERTPGFPFLIALAFQKLWLVIFFQLLLGLMNVTLLFKLCELKTSNLELSFWIAFITTSFLHFIFYEFAILTETLSLTLVLLSFYLIEKYKLLNYNASLKYLLILSIVFACLYLTRPMFIYFPIGFFIFFVAKNFLLDFKKSFLKGVLVLIVPFVCFYGWCSLNEKNIGYFTSTYYLGINLSQTATSFFDKASDENKLIRDIFIKHRNYVVSNKPKSQYPMSVWYAFDELLDKTNYTPQLLSYELGEISKDLFVKNPDLYLKQVLISWKDFWGASSSLLWNVDKYESKIIRRLLVGLWNFIQKPLLILFNILFILFSLIKIKQFILSRFKSFDFDLFLVAIVLSGSLAQALIAYGTNSRFCFPFLPLIVYFVAINVISYKKHFKNYAKHTFP